MGNVYKGKVLNYFCMGVDKLLGWAAMHLLPDTGRLRDRYNRNRYFMFKPNDVIVVKSGNCIIHGVRPVGIVKGYTREVLFGKPRDCYRIMMEKDVDVDYSEWLETGMHKPGTDRTARLEIHFKGYIERDFIKTPDSGLDTLAHYLNLKPKVKKPTPKQVLLEEYFSHCCRLE
jgi:hypothetical protein